MKKYILLFVAVTSTFLACTDDFIEIDERGVATASTMNDLKQVVDGINAGVATGANFQDIKRVSSHFELYYTDEFSELSSVVYNDLSEFERRSYDFEDLSYFVNDIDPTWSGYYQIVSSANFVINRLELPDPLNQRDQVEGTARAYRAFAYLWLVNIYADVYSDATATSSLGVPLIEEFGNPETSLARATVQEVYDLIISDLTIASELLNETNPSGVYQPNKAAAFGLLAKAYLQMGKYDLAQQSAEDALALNNTLVDYNTLPISNIAIDFDFGNLQDLAVRPATAFDPETIFYFENQGNLSINEVRAGVFLTIAGERFTIFPFSTSFVTPEIDALGDANDIRFSKMIFERSNGEKRFIGQNRIVGPSQGIPKGVNVSELLLIQAEAEARTGDFNTAMTILNNFRATRFLNTAPAGAHELTAANQDEAIQHVLDERQREFMYRGYRMFDIKRLNAHHNAGISATHVNPTDGSSVTLDANSPKWNAPIPPAEIAFDSELEQNPRN